MAFRSSASATGTGTGTITATPAGVQAHDYLGGWWLADGSATPTLTPPSGWTQRASVHTTLDGETQFYADKDDATGSDAFGFSDNSAGNNKALITAAWSGRNNSAPRSATPVTTGNSVSNTSPISATITGITAVNGDDIGIGLGNDEDTAGARWTESTIASYTQQVNGVAVDFVSGAGLQTRDNVSAGATGNFAVTITRTAGLGNSGYCGIVVAIAAAATSGSVGMRNSRIPNKSVGPQAQRYRFHRTTPLDTTVANAATTVSDSFSSAAAATATFTTQSSAAVPFSSAGVATATFATASSASTAFSSAGVATATFNAQSSAAVAFSSAGSATATFTTQSGAQSPLSAAGVATATFTTQSSVATPFAMAGVSTATFSTKAGASADFTMSGTATAVFTATTGASSTADAFMAGSATANFAAASLAPSAFTVSGQATVLFRGQAVTPNQRPYLQWGKRPPAHETYDEEILALSHAMGSYLLDMVEGRYVSKAKIKLGKKAH